MSSPDRVLEQANRLVRDRTQDGARLRRRAVALTAFLLMVAGFLLAVGLGLVVLVAAAALGAFVGAISALRLARRATPGVHVPRVSAPARRALKDGVEAAGRGAISLAGNGRKLLRDGRARAGERSRSSPARLQQEAVRLNARGVRHRRRGDYAEAVASHEAALRLLRRIGERRGEALTLNSLALALAEAGRDAEAVERFERALALLRQLDDGYREAQVVANLGFVHARSGRRGEAAECLRAALGKLEPSSQEYRRVEEQLRRAS